MISALAPEPHEARLGPGRAVLWLLAAGVAAQVAGALVSGGLRALLSARGASGAELEHAPWVVMPAMAASTLALLAVVVIGALSSGVSLRSALGLRPAHPLAFGAAALGTVMLGPSADLLMQWAERLFPEATLGVIPMLHDVARGAALYWVWPVFALLPGIAEELAFRGLLQRSMARSARAIVISGVGFALFHVDPHHVLGVLPLGLFLAWVGARAGTTAAAFAHVVNNTVAVASVRSEALSVGYGSVQPMPIEWIPMSLVVCAAAALVLHRVSGRPAQHEV
jgi:membrane protease YdiL (CAAX protease family)